VVELKKLGDHTGDHTEVPKAPRLRRRVLHGGPQPQWGESPRPPVIRALDHVQFHALSTRHSAVMVVTLSPGKGAKYCDQCVCVCLFVCLPVRSRISETSCPNFTEFSADVTCDRGSVLFGRQCSNALCISGFVDDDMFSHNRANMPESKTTRMFRSVLQVAAPEKSLPPPTASCYCLYTASKEGYHFASY